MPERPKREIWVDAAKALALVLVVVGHPVSPAVYTKYIYWFHMPVFFLLSGYLFKPVNGWQDFGAWVGKRCRELLVPYVVYLVLVTLVRYLFASSYLYAMGPGFVWNDLQQVALGGRLIGGYYTVFWFFPCLLATQILFALISLLCRNNSRMVMAAVAAAYLLAHAEAWWMASHPSYPVMVPWNLDVALMAIAYYAAGYFGRKPLAGISPPVTLAAVTVSALLIAGDHAGRFGYVLNLKYVVYNHLLLDLLIPMVMTIGLLGISQLWARSRLGPAVNWLGHTALPIVYLHVPINTVLLYELHFHYGNAVAALIGFLAPLALSVLLFERFAVTQLLFQGRVPPPAFRAPAPSVLPAGGQSFPWGVPVSASPEFLDDLIKREK